MDLCKLIATNVDTTVEEAAACAAEPTEQKLNKVDQQLKADFEEALEFQQECEFSAVAPSLRLSLIHI